MKAVHSNWTMPRKAAAGIYYSDDFDLLTTILSALKWREKNGEIKMVTDSEGLRYYSERGMCGIWDEIGTELDNIPETIDPKTFWAAGKIYSLIYSGTPTAVIDTDFIVWDRIAFDNIGELAVIHDEDIYPDVYPDIAHFNMKQGYIFDPDLDWRVRPANTAFYVIKNRELADRYTGEAVRFMENSVKGDGLTYMVFAEQRLLSMTAKLMGVDMYIISTLDRLFKDGERWFTHTWGMKQQMRDNAALRADFCMRCIRRIISDFPEYENMLRGIDELKPYF